MSFVYCSWACCCICFTPPTNHSHTPIFCFPLSSFLIKLFLLFIYLFLFYFLLLFIYFRSFIYFYFYFYFIFINYLFIYLFILFIPRKPNSRKLLKITKK